MILVKAVGRYGSAQLFTQSQAVLTLQIRRSSTDVRRKAHLAELKLSCLDIGAEEVGEGANDSVPSLSIDEGIWLALSWFDIAIYDGLRPRACQPKRSSGKQELTPD